MFHLLTVEAFGNKKRLKFLEITKIATISLQKATPKGSMGLVYMVYSPTLSVFFMVNGR